MFLINFCILIDSKQGHNSAPVFADIPDTTLTRLVSNKDVYICFIMLCNMYICLSDRPFVIAIVVICDNINWFADYYAGCQVHIIMSNESDGH